jgi:type IV secretory pathway VirB6-like protein
LKRSSFSLGGGVTEAAGLAASAAKVTACATAVMEAMQTLRRARNAIDRIMSSNL